MPEPTLRPEPRKTGSGRTGLSVYLFYLFALTLAPYEFSIDRFMGNIRNWPAFIRMIFLTSPADLAANILLFLPFGFLMYSMNGSTTAGGSKKRRLTALFMGLALSAFVETAQLFIPPRSFSVHDLAMNGLGTFLGFLAGERWIRRWRIHSFGSGSVCRRLRPAAVAAYAAALLWLSTIPCRVNDFRGWNSDYPIILGNEANGNRPWLGELDRLAIFDRCLNGRELRFLAASNPAENPAALRSFPDDPVLFCPLTASGTDTSAGCMGNEEAKTSGFLKGSFLSMSPPGSGLKMRGGNQVRTADSSKTAILALKRASRMTISVWLRTDALNQTGPARIISSSRNADERNFTLAQDGRGLVFRVRTMQAGPNGSRIRASAADIFRDREWHHVAAVFNRGYSRLFVDGKAVGRPVRVPDDYLPDLVGMGRSLFSKIAFWTALLLPFGWLASGFAGKRRNWAGFSACVLLIASVQALILWHLGQPFGF